MSLELSAGGLLQRRVNAESSVVAVFAGLVVHLGGPFDRHHYLDAFGIWNHTGGREGGDAYWQFHVKTGS
jgi:hypothetical protein